MVKQWNDTAMPADSYDGSGNVRNHPALGQYTYDGENRVKTAVAGVPGVTTSYEYDGEGRRVKKTAGTATTVYVYEGGGGHDTIVGRKDDSHPLTQSGLRRSECWTRSGRISMPTDATIRSGT